MQANLQIKMAFSNQKTGSGSAVAAAFNEASIFVAG
jgi:hypothetical protein